MDSTYEDKSAKRRDVTGGDGDGGEIVRGDIASVDERQFSCDNSRLSHGGSRATYLYK